MQQSFQWSTQPNSRVIQGDSMFVPEQSGGGIMDWIKGAAGLASILSGFGVGGAAMSGASNALNILGGGSGADGAVNQAGTTVNPGIPSLSDGKDSKEEGKEDIKDEQPEPTKIETTPIPKPANMFNPQGVGAGPQDWIMQMLMSGMFGNQGQVPYSSQTNFQRGY